MSAPAIAINIKNLDATGVEIDAMMNRGAIFCHVARTMQLIQLILDMT